MNDRQAVEKRYNEYQNAMFGADRYLFAAAISLIGESGWKWQYDRVKAGHGWWTKSNTEYSHPMGDAKDMPLAAYKTVQLYTDIELEKILQRAEEYRTEDTKRMYSNR